MIATAVAMLLVVAIHWPTATTMASIWARSDTFAHGFVVIPLSAWLAWRERSKWRRVGKMPAPWFRSHWHWRRSRGW
ncbi:MAG: archaeosortase/exosortase family protein [Betaproteobacteria bacterium]|nr:archaeosortase/exosortase family protein [Betaproteobacteria bacterium]